MSREAEWATLLNRLGYAVLMVDSFTRRGIVEMCSQRNFRPEVYRQRAKDAYGALLYLQTQPFIQPNRIALMGWSQGGGAVLLTIRKDSLGRPIRLPQEDFRAAVAFYPASCSEKAHKKPWMSDVPLLILVGEKDRWTPAAPCKEFAEGALERGARIEIHVYPEAYHDFDWPSLPPQELPAYVTRAGVTPIVGTDPSARADALDRVPAFLARYLR